MKAIFFFLVSFAFTISFAQEGLVKSYFPNDSLKSEINYARNVREGAAKFYYENGHIKEEVTYVNGRVEGVVKQYDENGILKELFTIEDGKRQGPTSYYDDKGTWTGDKDFANGIRALEKETIPATTEVASDESAGKNTTSQKTSVKKTEDKMVPPDVIENNSEDDHTYHLSAEVMPEPKEGMAALQKKLIYPSYAKEHKIEGTVKIRAFIDQNGDVTLAEVVEGIGYGCDDTARITVLYTKFNPGLIRGKPVKTQLIIPLEFKLDKQD
jgi:TonB family protein